MKKWLNRFKQTFSLQNQPEEDLKVELAAAVLCYEMSRVDFQVDDVELGQIQHSLKTLFDISSEDAKRLILDAKSSSDDLHDYQKFTNVIHDSFDYPMKIKLVELMWRIALSDGKIDHHESHFISKIADLIYLRREDLHLTKDRVLGN
jgi:uncharacterized tellurite resistance protein B-like protein